MGKPDPFHYRTWTLLVSERLLKPCSILFFFFFCTMSHLLHANTFPGVRIKRKYALLRFVSVRICGDVSVFPFFSLYLFFISFICLHFPIYQHFFCNRLVSDNFIFVTGRPLIAQLASLYIYVLSLLTPTIINPKS